MKKSIIKVLDLPSSGLNLILFILTAAFLIGSFAGCIFASEADDIGNGAMINYINGYLLQLDERTVNSISLLWSTVQWPLFLLIFSLTPAGLIGIPILFVIRGFLLSFAVAAFCRAYDLHGLLLAFIAIGITGLLHIPVLFACGVQGFLSSGTLAGRLLGESGKQPIIDRAGLIRLAICAVILFFSYLIDRNLIPVLLQKFASMIQT